MGSGGSNMFLNSYLNPKLKLLAIEPTMFMNLRNNCVPRPELPLHFNTLAASLAESYGRLPAASQFHIHTLAGTRLNPVPLCI